METSLPLVGIVMGSDSDWPTMKAAVQVCREFEVASEARVLSAHRSPAEATEYARLAHRRGIRVLVAGAGGAAHLPGVLASYTSLPVIGVPIQTGALRGLDSLLSIVQMPSGVPVAAVAIGGARNAGILAVQILAATDQALRARLSRMKASLSAESRRKDEDLARAERTEGGLV